MVLVGEIPRAIFGARSDTRHFKSFVAVHPPLSIGHLDKLVGVADAPRAKAGDISSSYNRWESDNIVDTVISFNCVIAYIDTYLHSVTSVSSVTTEGLLARKRLITTGRTPRSAAISGMATLPLICSMM